MRGTWWRRVLLYGTLVVAEIFALFPFWWMITTSLKHQVEIFSGLELAPTVPTLDNFFALFETYNFGPFLANSIIVVAFSVALSLLLGTPAAYALTKLPTEGWLQKQALIIVLLVRMLPAILLVIPFYIVLANYQLLNTRLIQPDLIALFVAVNLWESLAEIFLNQNLAEGVASGELWGADMTRLVVPAQFN